MKLYLVNFLIKIPALMIAMTCHGYAQAYMADKLGDKTPKFEGRLSLNPFAHIDILGFIMFLVVGFGWSKSVNISGRNFRNFRKDDLKVSIIGPLSNLVLAFLCSIILAILFVLVKGDVMILNILQAIITQTLIFNVLFGVLNLIPLPGFDGFRILTDLFPRKTYKLQNIASKYSIYILIAVIVPFLPGGYSVISFLISKPTNAIIALLNKLIFFIVGIF